MVSDVGILNRPVTWAQNANTPSNPASCAAKAYVLWFGGAAKLMVSRKAAKTTVRPVESIFTESAILKAAQMFLLNPIFCTLARLLKMESASKVHVLLVCAAADCRRKRRRRGS